MAKMVPIPKKSLDQRIKEEELNVVEKAERSINLSIDKRRAKAEKCKRLKSEEKQQLLDFVFGKSTINPLEDK